jgi:GNAT superfamily N-acetyltransferase
LPPEFQGFEQERQSLLLIAREGREAAGTVSLRPLSAEVCEAKRLWVRPPYRGLGLGRVLMERLLQEAKEIGYLDMVADSLPSMGTAQRLYRLLGFRDTAPYSPSPTPGAVFLRLTLY